MNQQTRKDQRARIMSLRVRYKSATVDQFIEHHAHNVSRGGMFIKTDAPLAAGTLLKFEMRLRGNEALMAGVGRVAWQRDRAQATPDNPAGMGIKFIKLEEASRAVLDRLVAERLETSADAEHMRPSPIGGPEPEADVDQNHAPPTSTISASELVDEPSTSGSSSGSSPPSDTRPSTTLGYSSTQILAASVASLNGTPSGRTLTEDVSYNQFATHAPVTGDVLAVGSANVELPAPSTRRSSDAPTLVPTGDPTLTKQAAELLEQTLLEAGGSLDDVHVPSLVEPREPPVRSSGVAPPPVSPKRLHTAISSPPADAPQRPMPLASSPPDRAPVGIAEPEPAFRWGLGPAHRSPTDNASGSLGARRWAILAVITVFAALGVWALGVFTGSERSPEQAAHVTPPSTEASSATGASRSQTAGGAVGGAAPLVTAAPESPQAAAPSSTANAASAANATNASPVGVRAGTETTAAHATTSSTTPPHLLRRVVRPKPKPAADTGDGIPQATPPAPSTPSQPAAPDPSADPNAMPLTPSD